MSKSSTVEHCRHRARRRGVDAAADARPAGDGAIGSAFVNSVELDIVPAEFDKYIAAAKENGAAAVKSRRAAASSTSRCRRRIRTTCCCSRSTTTRRRSTHIGGHGRLQEIPGRDQGHGRQAQRAGLLVGRDEHEGQVTGAEGASVQGLRRAPRRPACRVLAGHS